jgi:hypothetical protein
MLVHDVVEGHLVRPHQAAQPHFIGFDAELPGDGIHDEFDREAYARSGDARNGACPAQAAVRSRHDGWPPMTWQPRHHARSLSLALRQQIVEAELAQHAERGCTWPWGRLRMSLRSARGSCGAYSSRKGSG